MAESRQQDDGGGEGDGKSGESSAASGSHGDHDKMLQNLKSQPWFWPYTTREDVERMMVGQRDGSFMIRECSVPGDYTLTVRYEGRSKLIRIYQHPSGYSLVPPSSSSPSDSAAFPSLQELVEFYKDRSLASFNKRLDVCLLQAVSKPASAECNQYGVFKELYDLSQEELSAETRLSVLQQQRLKLDNSLKVLGLLMPALHVVKQMYFDSMAQQTETGPLSAMTTTPQLLPGAAAVQPACGVEESESGVLDLSRVSSDRADKETEDTLKRPLSVEEEKSLIINTRLIMSRHKEISSKLYAARSHHDLDTTRLHELDAELQAVQLSLLRMKRRHDELVSMMVKLGSERDYLSQVLKTQVATQEFDRSMWLVDCDRDEALSRLEQLPHGAFLVRLKDKRQMPYVLSVMVSPGTDRPPIVQHCYIVHPHGRGYGFNAALAVFESLDQLILKHRYLSLRHYFKKLDVTLSFPVGCQELLKRRSESDLEQPKQAKDAEGYANADAVRGALRGSVYEVIPGEESENLDYENAEGKPLRKKLYESITVGSDSSSAKSGVSGSDKNLLNCTPGAPVSDQFSDYANSDCINDDLLKDHVYEYVPEVVPARKDLHYSCADLNSGKSGVSSNPRDSPCSVDHLYEDVLDVPGNKGNNPDVSSKKGDNSSVSGKKGDNRDVSSKKADIPGVLSKKGDNEHVPSKMGGNSGVPSKKGDNAHVPSKKGNHADANSHVEPHDDNAYEPVEFPSKPISKR